MGKGKLAWILAAMFVAASFTAVPLAGAYSVPGAPGTPGGQPTKPKGGDSASKNVTSAAAQSIAGYTGLELALRTPSVTFKFPKAGVASCTMSAGRTLLGSGSASKGSKGNKTFLVLLTNGGRTYLYNHNGQAVSVTVACRFSPDHGRSSKSTSTVVLDA